MENENKREISIGLALLPLVMIVVMIFTVVKLEQVPHIPLITGTSVVASMGGGIVATIIYFGLRIITPAWFLVNIALICTIVALTIGGSWSTRGQLVLRAWVLV